MFLFIYATIVRITATGKKHLTTLLRILIVRGYLLFCAWWLSLPVCFLPFLLFLLRPTFFLSLYHRLSWITQWLLECGLPNLKYHEKCFFLFSAVHDLWPWHSTTLQERFPIFLAYNRIVLKLCRIMLPFKPPLLLLDQINIVSTECYSMIMWDAKNIIWIQT